MENQTSFDLSLAIQRWRENLAQSAALRSENLNELESHLRDSIATLQTAGLSGEEAFVIAGRRIGAAQQLETEFGKLNAKSVWLDRLLWMLIGTQAWAFAYGTIRGATWNLLALGWMRTNYDWREKGLALPLAEYTLVRLLCLAISIWCCWWLIFKKGGRFSQWLRGKLQARISFVGYCVTASFLALGAQVLTPAMSAYIRWKFGFNGIGDAMNSRGYMGVTDLIINFILIVGMVVMTLALARKRFRMKYA